MAKEYVEPPIIQYYPNTAGYDLTKWKGGRELLAYKICPQCGKEFRPNIWNYTKTEKDFAERQFCSHACSTKYYPGHVSQQSHAGFTRRGGNGTYTKHQILMLQMLGEDWVLELPVCTHKQGLGYPSCYKLDVGNPKLKIGIEVDGRTTPQRRERADKKDALLLELGWKIFHITNKEVEALFIIYKSQNTRPILQMVF